MWRQSPARSGGRASRRWQPIRRAAAAAPAGLVVIGLAAASLTVAGGAAAGQEPAAAGAFTADQAAAGWAAYARSCGECHGAGLRGSSHGPELRGAGFLSSWGARTTAELVDYLRAEMPPGLGGSLGEATYLGIVAYLLEVNGHEAGPLPLAADSAIVIDAARAGAPRAGRGGDAAGEPEADDAPRRRRFGFVNREAPALAPVTDALLQQPPPADWLSWRRTLDNHGYSPLDQIAADNVKDLRLAWVLAIREGNNQTTPVVHDGVMFLASPGNVVQAIDAATGEVFWEYRHPLAEDAPSYGATRALALYRDKVFLATYDAALVALDARTGEVAWKTVKADHTQGFMHFGGPVVADGVVVTGINGCQRYKDETCFITGHDPDTGAELWRTSTIALPGDPNNASWGDVPPFLRAGGDMWIPGSYDPGLGLFYIGTAQAKPWVAASRGMTTRQDALYTNSTLALNPRTGQIQWYFQHVPGETLDLDIVYERVLIDADGEQLLFTIGKDGILWKLDRRTGRFLDLRETVYQDIFESIDRETGRVTYRPDIRDAGIGDRVAACPSLYGGHNWKASAYHPGAGALVIPLHQVCMHLTGREVDRWRGAAARRAGPSCARCRARTAGSGSSLPTTCGRWRSCGAASSGRCFSRPRSPRRGAWSSPATSTAASAPSTSGPALCCGRRASGRRRTGSRLHTPSAVGSTSPCRPASASSAGSPLR